MIVLHKKEEMSEIQNYMRISLLSHVYKLFTRITVDENQTKRIGLFQERLLDI